MITEHQATGGMHARCHGGEVEVRPCGAYNSVWIEALDAANGYALVSVSAEDAAALARHILELVGAGGGEE